MANKKFSAGQAVYVWSYCRGRKFEKEHATAVTGNVREMRWEGVGDPEPHVLISLDGLEVWEPTRKVFAA